MNRNKSDAIITCVAEGGQGDTHKFCQLNVAISDHMIGDPSAWSVVRLMIGAISDLCSTLQQQYSLPAASREFLQKLDPSEIFEALYSLQWCSAEWAYEKECPISGFRNDLFNALPLGNEIFDGESAFILICSDENGRMMWRDYESKEIYDFSIDFTYYLRQWDAAMRKLKEVDDEK